MECNLAANRRDCPCTYEPCSRKGRCCECVAYHRENRELPGCFFSKAGERAYDRSIAGFIRDQGKR
ncbi:hypothetical protein FJY71_09510 [candidate division WOR-3 bacterium]|nr:hypothetical protein [candidate division WOR-3 bacterium]